MASRLVTWACSGASGSSAGAGHGGRDDVEERVEAGLVGHVAVGGAVAGGAARAAGGVDDGQVEEAGGDGLVELELVGQLEQELEALVDDLGAARVGAVGLVDHEDDGQARHEGLAQHEAGLRQRALARVDEQEHAVDHGQAALDLTAEIGVARRVDDVDGHAAPVDRRVLGEDRDALLALQVARVHARGRRGQPARRTRRRRAAWRRPGWSCRGRRAPRWRRCAGAGGPPGLRRTGPRARPRWKCSRLRVARHGVRPFPAVTTLVAVAVPIRPLTGPDNPRCRGRGGQSHPPPPARANHRPGAPTTAGRRPPPADTRHHRPPGAPGRPTSSHRTSARARTDRHTAASPPGEAGRRRTALPSRDARRAAPQPRRPAAGPHDRTGRHPTLPRAAAPRAT